jgi:uncharacterized membrane protein YkvA (DUF1232 family)
MSVTNMLREIGSGLASELKVYRLVVRHERTSRMTRLLLGGALGYAFSPIDLIPDWLPVVGHLDDVLIVLLLVWLGMRFVLPGVVDECRVLARGA